jgi:hypothetical protein
VFNLVKNISAMALLLVFLISSSGFTIATHYCSGSKKTTQSIKTGFAAKDNGCGGMSCGIAKNHARAESPGSISKSSCCKENSIFYKIAPVNNDLTSRLPVISPLQNILFQGILFQTLFSAQKQQLTILREQFFPPPKAGKQLILFLQQIRIPSPAPVS